MPFGEKHAPFIWTPEAKKNQKKIQPFTGAPVTENLFLDNNSANRLTAEFAMISHLFRVTILVHGP
jgi:hypothetical protein